MRKIPAIDKFIVVVEEDKDCGVTLWFVSSILAVRRNIGIASHSRQVPSIRDSRRLHLNRRGRNDYINPESPIIDSRPSAEAFKYSTAKNSDDFDKLTSYAIIRF